MNAQVPTPEETPADPVLAGRARALHIAMRLQRVGYIGFAAALIGEWLTGYGPAGQVMALVRWYLS